jgi:hypothetical protein
MADYKFKSLTDQILALDKALEDTSATAKKLGEDLKRASAPKEIIKIQKELNSESVKLVKTQKELNTVRKKSETLDKQAAKEAQKYSLEIQKRIAAERQLAKDIRDQANAEIRLKRAVKGSLESMRASIVVLKQRHKNLEIGTKRELAYRKKIAETTNELKRQEAAIGVNTRNVGNYSGALQKGISSLKDYAKGLIGITAAFAAIRRISQAAQEYINLAREQIIQETKLTTVLKQRTKASDAQVKSILALVSAQQEQGVIGDEVQIAGAQQLGTFVNQTSTLEKLIPAMNNLVAQQKGLNASSGDAVNIGNLLGKALQGQVGALSRVGISFDETQAKILKTGTEMERAAVLADVITQNVGNMNAELAKTDVGRIQQLDNQIGDLKEEIGKELIPIMRSFKSVSVTAFQSILDLTKDLTEPLDLIRELSDSIKSNREEASKFQEGAKKLGKELRILINPIRAIIRYNAILVKGFREALRFFGLLESEQAKRAGELRKRIDELTQSFLLLEDTQKNKVYNSFVKLQEQFIKGEINALQFANQLNNLILLAQEATTDFEEFGDAVGNAADEIFELGRAIDRGNFESVSKAVKGITDDLKNNKGVVKDVLEDPIIKAFNAIIKKRKEDAEDQAEKEARELEAKKEVIAQTVNLYRQLYDFIGQQTANEIKRLDELIKTQEKSINKTEKKLEEEKKLYTEATEEGKAYNRSIIEGLETRLKVEKKQLQESEKAQRAARERQKNQEIGTATINIAAGVIRAFKDYSFPYSLIVGALVAAAGAVQIATIKNQKFAEGGWIGGRSHAEGGTVIEAEKDEFVVRKKYAPGAANILDMINKGLITDNSLRSGMHGSNYFINDNGEVVKRLDKVVENTTRKDVTDANGKIVKKFYNNHTISFN